MRLSSAAGIAHARRALFSLTALVSSACFGQQLDPVQWSLSSDVQRVRPGDSIAFQLTATIEPGWHLYSLTTPKGGPIPTTATLKGGPVQSAAFYQPAPDRRFDQNFNLDTETFADKAPLLVSGVVPVGTTDGDVDVTTEVRYQACSDRQCLPPRKKTASLTILVDAAAPAQRKVQIPAGYTSSRPPKRQSPRFPTQRRPRSLKPPLPCSC